MPVYTYVCQSCGAEIERRQSFAEPLLTTCESCGGSLRKLLHPAGVIFKGSGFYNTDYKRSSSSSSNGSASNGSASKSADAGAKSESAATPASSDAKS